MNIDFLSIHGLIRGEKIELGRDADTGGQTRYVMELVRELGQCPEVGRVRLFTRKIEDPDVSPDYSVSVETLATNCQIVRVPCGTKKYLRKELLWPHLDEFAERTIEYIDSHGQAADVVHGHYADAGVVAGKIAAHYGVPFIFTGHSLGKPKLKMLLSQGFTLEKANRQFAIQHRISEEQRILSLCDTVIASTRHEAETQYAEYDGHPRLNFQVIPPGFDIDRFYSYQDAEDQFHDWSSRWIREISRFLNEPNRSSIVSICRPERRKNLAALVRLYGENKSLQKLANLVLIVGNRDDIGQMPANEREVLTDILLLVDRYDLYGKVAYPKCHCSETDIPDLLRYAARRGGVFVNPAHFEPFGLTTIESAAVGLPFVATNQGGPVEVAARTEAGIVVDVDDQTEMTNSIRRLLTDQSCWRQMSSAGISNVPRYYSWSAHSAKYLEALHHLIPVTDSRSDCQVPTVCRPSSFGDVLAGRVTHNAYLPIANSL